MKPDEKTNAFNFNGKSFAITGSERDESIMRLLEMHSGEYEPHIASLLPKIVKPRSVCLDIGANIGVITLALSSLTPDGHVYAFEPSSYNYEFLLKNLASNGVSNVTPVNLAVYDTNGTLDFNYIDEFAGGSFSSSTGHTHPTAVHETVRCVRLDDWVKESAISRLDFIKLDVEGAEVRAIHGMRATLKKFKPKLIIEFNAHTLTTFFNESEEGLFDLLASIYPRVYLIDRTEHDLRRIRTFPELRAFVPTPEHVQDLYCAWIPISARLKELSHMLFDARSTEERADMK